jgi:hypothetical protein
MLSTKGQRSSYTDTACEPMSKDNPVEKMRICMIGAQTLFGNRLALPLKACIRILNYPPLGTYADKLHLCPKDLFVGVDSIAVTANAWK